MAASYPDSLKLFQTKTDKVDLVDDDHINDVQNEIVAIETELGTDVAGSETDLKTRLAVSIANDGAVAKDTSFPGSTVAGQLFFRTDEDKLYYRNAADDAWTQVLDDALSNLVFHFSNGTDYNKYWDDNYGLFTNTSSLTPDETDDGFGRSFWGVQSTEYKTVLRSKFKKIAGISTITVYCRIWNDSQLSGDYAKCQVDVGGQTGSVNGTDGTKSPEWKNFTVDVSSLSDGTVYDVQIQLHNNDVDKWTYLDSIIAFGS
jgi:hypothetical protein